MIGKKVVIGIWAVSVAGVLIELMVLLESFSITLNADSSIDYFFSHQHYGLLVTSPEVRDFFIQLGVCLILGIVLFLLPGILHFKGILHFARWQKALVFVLSIIIISSLAFIVPIFQLENPYAGIWVLPFGIIWGIIFPFILFAVLEKNPDKAKNRLTNALQHPQ